MTRKECLGDDDMNERKKEKNVKEKEKEDIGPIKHWSKGTKEMDFVYRLHI